MIPLVAIGVFVMVLLLRNPRALDHEPRSDDATKRRSPIGLVAWIVGGVGLAIAVGAVRTGRGGVLRSAPPRP